MGIISLFYQGKEAYKIQLKVYLQAKLNGELVWYDINQHLQPIL
jgi:hypothetical protein